MDRVKIVCADITQLKVDCIVNAANESLLGGGGVDGAIHRVAGPDLLNECRAVGPCPTGDVRLTKGYNLPAMFIIHAVGPVWDGGGYGEDALLADCYRHALSLAIRSGIRTIAFPAISTGVYGFPLQRAAGIAVDEVERFLRSDSILEEVIFCCFSNEAVQAYKLEVGRIDDR